MSNDTTNPEIPATMRAISQDAHGGPEVLHLVEKEVPAPGLGEVLVRVRAAGVNPTDYKHRSGRRFLGDPPYVLGWDVSGVVVAVGIGVTLYRPGDEVFGMLPYAYGAGSHAEYVTGPTRAFAPKPSSLDHVHAAAVPLAALTAWQALVDTADLKAGQKVLVHAAAGGVGHFAVQIAKARGARVVGTASARKHDFVKGLGADEVVDYTSQDFTEAVSDADAVLETVSPDNALRSLDSLKPGGIVVSILPTGTDRLASEAHKRGLRGAEMVVEHDQAGMRAVGALVDAGALRPEIAGVFPLEKAADAHREGETGRVQGKLVLSVSED
ncbi:NADP-dependent oxidoreductase [Nocardiopsis suaedae]|uniref:NADP-dependent oxidoreductase n=1 Tax=Nocardiopsis suaedae TaxID=3018444 RepID=A0ABT4TF87_9ACTN|nr:NADP-dependent oxidoreductase [Nocardiopsis suaedae]MDA2803291.1 NADP-dependent oxidoreductase [Nocardiopsis suaedae]